MTDETNTKLCFLSGKPAEIVQLSGYDGYSFKTEDFGQYWLDRETWHALQGRAALSDQDKLICLKEVSRLNIEKIVPFFVLDSESQKSLEVDDIVFREIEDMKGVQIDHKGKEEKILRMLASKLNHNINPFAFTHLTTQDRYSIGVFTSEEYFRWIKHLLDSGFVRLHEETEVHVAHLPAHQNEVYMELEMKDTIALTVEGWDKAHNLLRARDTKNAFIAMAFTDQKGNELPRDVREKIKSTLSAAGWNPIVVDEVEHNDGIMDKVLASINEARFVISELTHQKSGVYYEAGYAKGRGIPVIHIVHDSEKNACHFDVKHLNLIIWKDLDELARRLKNRIKATITYDQ